MTHSNNQSSVVPFDFKGNQVRAIADSDGEFWFVASDVCSSLDLSNVSQALSRLDTDEKDDIILNDAIGRPQSTAIISESGLYSLALSSRKEEAKAFKRWITHDVLPQLRKTGSYSIQQHDDPMAANIAGLEMIVTSIKDMYTRQQQLEARVDRLDNKNRMFTIKAFARLNGLALSDKSARAIGKRAAKMCRENGITIGSTYDETYGSVNTYREDILEQAWGE